MIEIGGLDAQEPTGSGTIIVAGNNSNNPKTPPPPTIDSVA
jgi:hypothetical protein